MGGDCRVRLLTCRGVGRILTRLRGRRAIVSPQKMTRNRGCRRGTRFGEWGVLTCGIAFPVLDVVLPHRNDARQAQGPHTESGHHQHRRPIPPTSRDRKYSFPWYVLPEYRLSTMSSAHLSFKLGADGAHM